MEHRLQEGGESGQLLFSISEVMEDKEEDWEMCEKKLELGIEEVWYCPKLFGSELLEKISEREEGSRDFCPTEKGSEEKFCATEKGSERKIGLRRKKKKKGQRSKFGNLHDKQFRT